jgi:RNA polymerase sigma-70 factor, ECF subfamily
LQERVPDKLLTVMNPLREADRQLAERCKAGDAAAERALYDAHVERVYRLAHRMAGDPDLAEDITQDVFIRAFDKIEQYRGESALATWLHTITVSVALNSLRKVKRFPTQDLDTATNLAVHQPSLAPDLRERLHLAISALTEKLRVVFLMHVEGFTHEEIGEVLHIPAGTSKARLFEARAKLRTALAVFVGDNIA